MNRIFEVWIGPQATGKTFQLRRRAIAISRRKSIRRVVVVAPPGEWRDICDPVDIADLDSALEDWGAPREPVLVAGIQLGDREQLERVVALLTSWGDCALVIDEAALWVPSTWSTETLRGKMPRTFDAITRGRHLERGWDGLERPFGLLFAAQYPRSIHLLIHDQARVIMCSRPEGERSREWIRGTASREALLRAQALGPRQWTAIRGRDPRRG